MWVSFYGISERGDSGERKFYQHKCPFVGVVCYFCISTSSAEYRWFTYFSCITFVHQYFGLHLVQYFSWKKRRILSFQHGIEIPWSVTKEYFVLHCQQFLIGRGGIVQKEMHRKGGLPDVQKIRFQCKCRFCLFCEQILCQSMQNSLTGCRSNFFEMQRSIADQFDAMELT